MGKRTVILLLGLALATAVEETVYGFGSFALFSPEVRAGDASIMNEFLDGSGEFTLMKVLRSEQASGSAQEGGLLQAVLSLPLELEIGNRNPLKPMHNLRAEVLPVSSRSAISLTGEAVRIDIPRSQKGRYGLQLEIGLEYCEKLLNGEEKANVRLSWGHGLHQDIDLAKLLRENGYG